MRTRVKREKEKQLHLVLWEMRDAIDRYKDAADRGQMQIKIGTEGYPPDLETQNGQPGGRAGLAYLVGGGFDGPPRWIIR